MGLVTNLRKSSVGLFQYGWLLAELHFLRGHQLGSGLAAAAGLGGACGGREPPSKGLASPHWGPLPAVRSLSAGWGGNPGLAEQWEGGG